MAPDVRTSFGGTFGAFNSKVDVMACWARWDPVVEGKAAVVTRVVFIVSVVPGASNGKKVMAHFGTDVDSIVVGVSHIGSFSITDGSTAIGEVSGVVTLPVSVSVCTSVGVDVVNRAKCVTAH